MMGVRGEGMLDMKVTLWGLGKDDACLWEARVSSLGLNKETVLQTTPLAPAGMS